MTDTQNPNPQVGTPAPVVGDNPQPAAPVSVPPVGAPAVTPDPTVVPTPTPMPMPEPQAPVADVPAEAPVVGDNPQPAAPVDAPVGGDTTGGTVPPTV